MSQMEVDTSDNIVQGTLKRIASASMGVRIDKARREVKITGIVFLCKCKLIRTHRGNFSTVEIDVTRKDPLVRNYVITLYSFHISKKR